MHDNVNITEDVCVYRVVCCHMSADTRWRSSVRQVHAVRATCSCFSLLVHVKRLSRIQRHKVKSIPQIDHFCVFDWLLEAPFKHTDRCLIHWLQVIFNLNCLLLQRWQWVFLTIQTWNLQIVVTFRHNVEIMSIPMTSLAVVYDVIVRGLRGLGFRPKPPIWHQMRSTLWFGAESRGSAALIESHNYRRQIRSQQRFLREYSSRLIHERQRSTECPRMYIKYCVVVVSLLGQK